MKAAVPDADVDYMICEMSDVQFIKAFAEKFKEKWYVTFIIRSGTELCRALVQAPNARSSSIRSWVDNSK